MALDERAAVRRDPGDPAPAEAARWRRLVSARGAFCALVGLAVVYLAIVPLVTMIVASLDGRFIDKFGAGWGFSYYTEVLGNSSFAWLLARSCLYAGATAVVSVIVGFALAWLYVRTDTPGKAFALVVGIVPIIIPGVLSTVAWGLLLSPDVGPLNQLLNTIGLPQFNIYSMAGMIFVQTTHVVPVAFLIASADLAAADQSLEEAATASGASRYNVLRLITWPVVRPALLGATLLAFVQTLSSFEVPALIGVPAHQTVFGSRIYQLLGDFPPNYAAVGVMGVVVLGISVLGLYLSRRLAGGVSIATISGKAFKSAPWRLGKLRWLGFAVLVLYALVAVILPVAMLLWSALLPHYDGFSASAIHQFTLSNFSEVFSGGQFLPTLRNTVIAAVGTGLGVVVLCGLAAYFLEKSKVRGRSILDFAATVPIAVPSIVMGVGVLFWYLVIPLPFHVYGTLLILIVCYITVSMPYGMRFLRPAIGHIDNELEEAARVSGARWYQGMTRIYLPILVPAISGAFIFSFIVAFRELSASLFLYTPQNAVISVEIYQLFSYGQYPQVCAIGVVVIAFMVICVGLVAKLTGGLRRGVA